MRGSCYKCGYFREENGRYYCDDRDCIVDPFEPECNE